MHETTGAVGRYSCTRRAGSAAAFSCDARDAEKHGGDGTDYRNTSSFLEHYSQRLSAANVMHGAAEGLKAINRATKNRIARKAPLCSDIGV